MSLSCFDPDAEVVKKAPTLDLSGLTHCPTCKQALAKKIKRDEIWKVIRVFKMVSWPDVEDKAWDTMFYPRYMRPAKELILFMGDWKTAANAVQDLYEKFSELGCTVMFETICKHAANYKRDLMEREAKGQERIRVVE
jgi:hypothetical protein